MQYRPTPQNKLTTQTTLNNFESVIYRHLPDQAAPSPTFSSVLLEGIDRYGDPAMKRILNGDQPCPYLVH